MHFKLNQVIVLLSFDCCPKAVEMILLLNISLPHLQEKEPSQIENVAHKLFYGKKIGSY